MTNYRIDRIGTHRHALTRIGTEFDHIDTAKQGQGYECTVSRFEY